MEDIPFKIKDTEDAGVLTHLETAKDDSGGMLIRADYLADVVLDEGQVLLFTEHDGASIQLRVLSAASNGIVDLGPENVADFAIAFGLQ